MLAGILGLGVAPASAATTTIGQNSPGLTVCLGMGVLADRDYVAPGSGAIVAFAFKSSTVIDGNAGDLLDFKVLRPVGANQAQVVGGTGPRTLATSTALETFTPPAPIPVQAGDFLGWWQDGTDLVDGCAQTVAPGGSIRSGPTTNPPPGTIITLQPAGGEGLNLSAQFQPAGVCDRKGTPGRDVIVGTSRSEVICGLGGDDVIRGGGGNDKLSGGPGDDQLFGEAGIDRLNADAGADLLDGGAASDRLEGGTGNDVLRGRELNDDLFGQGGDDSLDGGDGNDGLSGGAGTDTCAQGPGHGPRSDCEA